MAYFVSVDGVLVPHEYSSNQVPRRGISSGLQFAPEYGVCRQEKLTAYVATTIISNTYFTFYQTTKPSYFN